MSSPPGRIIVPRSTRSWETSGGAAQTTRILRRLRRRVQPPKVHGHGNERNDEAEPCHISPGHHWSCIASTEFALRARYRQNVLQSSSSAVLPVESVSLHIRHDRHAKTLLSTSAT